ncbi:metalloprotease [Mycoemilia scoparia]|uniref:Metalloprotease n=1 Tax=Mycoemilia scoparia TaxID=417184 RepID=A0A9W8A236_9FUNG|nr:metalloprotease [Mycoemilia scoparia]
MTMPPTATIASKLNDSRALGEPTHDGSKGAAHSVSLSLLCDARKPKDVEDQSLYACKTIEVVDAKNDDGSEKKGNDGDVKKTTIKYYEYIGEPIKVWGTDTREYRLLRLKNNMEVMLIRDTEKNSAGAALSIGVGGLQDPPEFPGIAHFCEHMLFLGNEKYPVAGDFEAYLTKNNGFSNACTGPTSTSFFFEMPATNVGFEGALDRFSQFFISPLFNAEYADREVKAVDSEHKKNIYEDARRAHRLNQVLANPNHPYSNFMTGSYQTLAKNAESRGVSLRDVLLQFYNRYYSAEMMKLAIVCSSSLDQMTESVVAKFSGVINKGHTVPESSNNSNSKTEGDDDKSDVIAFRPQELGRLIRYKTIRKQYTLKITFPTFDSSKYYASKPYIYISHLLVHRGKTSLFAYLDSKNWVNSIYGTVRESLPKYLGVYSIFVHLTETGCESYKDVLRAIFSYLNMLRQVGPSEAIFKEITKNQDNSFEFDPIDYGFKLAKSCTDRMLHPYFPAHKLFTGHELVDFYSPKDIVDFLGYLTARNCFMTIGTEDKDGRYEYPFSEEHYDIKYRIDQIEDALLQELEIIAPYREFKLPQKNRFMCDGLPSDLVTGEEKNLNPDLQPTLLLKNNYGEVWHRKDDRFLVPTGEFILKLVVPNGRKDPKHSVYLDIYCMILRQELREPVSEIFSAGMGFMLETGLDCIFFKINGKTPKMLSVWEIIIDTIKSFNPSETRFKTTIDAFYRGLESEIHQEPDSQANLQTLQLTNTAFFDPKDSLDELKKVTLDDIKEYSRNLVAGFYFQILTVGNFEEVSSLSVYRLIRERLNPKPQDKELNYQNRYIRQNPEKLVVQNKATNQKTLNSALNINIIIGPVWDSQIVVYNDLLASLLNDQIYKQLRTKEQIGYMAHCLRIQYTMNYTGIRVFVKGEANPLYIHLRFNELVRDFRNKYLVELPEKDIQSQVESMIAAYEMPDPNTSAEFDRYWSWINKSIYKFFSHHEKIRELKNVTKGKLIEFWDRFVDPLQNTIANSYNGENVDEKQRTTPMIITQIFSTKIRKPTIRERQLYPETILALYSCLESEKVEGFDYSDIAEIVTKIQSEYHITTAATAIATPPTTTSNTDSDNNDDNMDEIVEMFKTKLKFAFSDIDAEQLDNAFKAKNSYSRLALEMAINSHIKPIDSKGLAKPTTTVNDTNGSVTQNNNATNGDGPIISMTPEKYKIIEDFKSYRKTLKIEGPPPICHDLTPKYSDY